MRQMDDQETRRTLPPDRSGMPQVSAGGQARNIKPVLKTRVSPAEVRPGEEVRRPVAPHEPATPVILLGGRVILNSRRTPAPVRSVVDR